MSHSASRNFRDIWYHFSEGFTEFRDKIQSSWPGMDIELPEVVYGGNDPLLRMTCPEERMPRELFWSGFGFRFVPDADVHRARERRLSVGDR